MVRFTLKLAAALRALRTGKAALGRWVVREIGGKHSGSTGGYWVCRRHCHACPDLPFAQGRLVPKRLGLRIISSKTEAVDTPKQQEHPRHEQDYANNTSPVHDEQISFSGGVKYSVIRINNDGTWEPLILNSSELGVPAKDLDLLADFVRMENVRALICKSHCLLFDAHHPRKGSFLSADGDATKRISKLSENAREAFANVMADHAKQLMQSNQGHLPFHLRMIECLLDETCSFFHQKVERLKLVAERILEELTTDIAAIAAIEKSTYRSGA